MAYMNQEKKAALVPGIKSIFKKYGVKASIGVRHHSTLVVNIKSSPIDFIGNFNELGHKNAWQSPLGFKDVVGNLDVNPYWYHEHFDGEPREFLKELITAMNIGNHDRSDIQSDYFDVGWYIDVNIGKWDKPYALIV